MIVGVCGFGYTGSGAILDYLKEFDENTVNDSCEFTISYTPDCIEDLEYHLVKSFSRTASCDTAIKRFKEYISYCNTPNGQFQKITNRRFVERSEVFINRLIQVDWNGFWGIDAIQMGFIEKTIKFRIMFRILRVLDKIRKKNTDTILNRKMYLSLKPESFYIEAKSYISDLLDYMGNTKDKNIVLDQPFAANNPEKSFVFFDNPKAIILERDPRDLYLLAKKVALSKARWIPSDNVEDFIKFYKLIREKSNVHTQSDQILYVKYEDLIYEYKDTSTRINNFLNLKEHTWPKKYFQPEISINNTQLFIKYKGFENDIYKIEKELEEWLYPFENYEKKTSFGDSF